MATALDVITRALRLIGVTASDETPQADDYAAAHAVYENEINAIPTEQGLTLGFTAAAPSDGAVEALAHIVASKVASTFGVQGPSYARGIARLRNFLLTDDREDRRDLDDDDTVTDAEIAASQRAAFY